MTSFRVVAGALALASLAFATTTRGDDGDAELARLVETVVTSTDWNVVRTAEQALERRGVAGARAALAARAKLTSARSRERLDRVLRVVVMNLAVEIQRPLVEPPPRPLAAVALGDTVACVDPSGGASITSEAAPRDKVEQAGALGADEPKSGYEAKQRAHAAHAGLLALGPAALSIAIDVPPVRPFSAARALGLAYGEGYALATNRIAKGEAVDAAAAKDLTESLAGVGDLASPFIAQGLRDPREAVREVFQRVRDDAIARALEGIDAPDPDRREASHDELWRLGDIVRPTLEKLAKEGKSSEARLAAERIAHRIRYRLSKDLIRKLGHELDGYATLPFDKRRSLAFELERLAGADAVPTLRALLREEPSKEVCGVCAIGLFKQGDWVGAEWLQVHGQKINLISKRDLAALIADQAMKYLMARKYEQAEKQFLKVLEIEPTNETALYNLACTYSLWGKSDEAVVYLKRAIDAGFDDVSHIEKDSDLDPIRDDPRYKGLVDALKKKKGVKH